MSAQFERPLQSLHGVGTSAPIDPLLPRMDSKAPLPKRAPKFRRSPVTGDESRNDHGRNSVFRAARAAVAEATPEAAGERGDFLEPRESAGGAVVAQRNSPPISSCNAFGSLTRPS